MIPYIDFHCDTLMTAWMAGRRELLTFPEAMLDVDRMKNGGVLAQFFAIYMLPEAEMTLSDDQYIAELAQIFRNSCTDPLTFAGSWEDFLKNEQAGKLSGFLTLEDGRAVSGSMEKLERFYNMGIRLISLTWNFENCFGYPNSRDRAVMEAGLKPFGKEAVLRMQELGMIVDVSHLSDGGFWDVAGLCTKPFVASHSNCRTLNPHPRSMTDEMIRTLADHGGVMGLNFCPAFLNQNLTESVSRIDDMVRQLRHMINTGGLEIAAIGTDLDGISGTLEIGSPDQMPLLFHALQKAGFSEDAIDHIAHKNARRVLRDTL